MNDASEPAVGGDNLGSANALETGEISDAPSRTAEADAVVTLQQRRAIPGSHSPSDDEETQPDAAMLPATRGSTTRNAPATPPLSDPESDEKIPLGDLEVVREDLCIAIAATSRLS